MKVVCLLSDKFRELVYDWLPSQVGKVRVIVLALEERGCSFYGPHPPRGESRAGEQRDFFSGCLRPPIFSSK
jgi:hypothetical protein